MRIVLHGATNWKSSNFGDYLYAAAIYDFIKKLKPDAEVGFYEPSQYFIQYLKCPKYGVLKADLLVYIPGGYFGQGHKARLIDNIIHFIRFMPVGLLASIRKIPIGIIGIGAGPIESKLFKVPIKVICDNAKVITVRDNQSYKALGELGVKNVIELSDFILALNLKDYQKKSAQVEEIVTKKNNRKLLFVHYNHSHLALEKFAQTLSKFLITHNEYTLVVGADCKLDFEEEYFKEFEQKVGTKCIHYIYDSPYEMITLLENMDAVLTCKLHVGVVATMFNKPVICLSEHPEKTIRYYEQINMLQNFASLYDSSVEDLLSLLEECIEKKCHVPDIEKEKAKKNYDVLQQLLKEL